MRFLTDVISSRNNNLVKWTSSLLEKKGRKEARSFVVEGEKLSFEALGFGLPVTHIFVCEDKRERIFPILNGFSNDTRYENTSVILLSQSAFEKISTEKSPVFKIVI